MEYQDRVNRPLGMSDVDLLIYDKDIYTMYRTHEGLEPDAFRYDPIVSAGMLASDYAYAEGMQWVNLLTPDSQDKINPGDDLVVPVRTYDYYGENLPIEKRLTHEVSYTSNQLNTARAMGLHNNFVGDFNNYFDQESGLLGENLLGPVPSPITEPTPSPIGGGSSLPPRSYEGGPRTLIPVRPYTPITNIQFTAPTTTPTPITPKYRCISTAPYYVRDDVNGTKNLLQARTCRPVTATTVSGSTPTIGGGSGSTSGSGTTTTTTTTTGGGISGGTSGGEVIDGGAFPMGGGGGGASGGGAEAPAQEETTPTQTPKTAVKKEIKADYKFILIGILILGAIGYYYAKTYNKDIKTFSVSGAIVGGILGYMYNQHQTKPIELFTKLGIKGKSESGYFIDDI